MKTPKLVQKHTVDLDLTQPTTSYFANYVFHKLTDKSSVVTITRALMRDSRSLYRIRDAVSDALKRLEAAGLVTKTSA